MSVVLRSGIGTRATWSGRLALMAGVGWSMMFRDRLKLLGTLFGVVFSVVFACFQMGTCLALVDKNETFVANTEADLWVMSPSVKQLQAGTPLSDLDRARASGTAGVAWVEPLLVRGAQVKLPSGGSEAVTLVGTRAPRFAGGPFHVVAGSIARLREPGALFVEDAQREKLGGAGLGDEREVNGRAARIVGLTWGLQPFAPPYAFAEETLAREILGARADEHDFLLVGVAPGEDPSRVKARLAAALPSSKVLSRAEFSRQIAEELLFESQIGVTFGATTAMGLLVGLITVSLSMLSSVADNLRFFGILKAMGSGNGDLAALLVVQASTYAVLGSLLGLGVIATIVQGARNAELTPIVPPPLMLGLAALMVLVCVGASVLSLLRVRRVEPAMVFR